MEYWGHAGPFRGVVVASDEDVVGDAAEGSYLGVLGPAVVADIGEAAYGTGVDVAARVDLGCGVDIGFADAGSAQSLHEFGI